MRRSARGFIPALSALDVGTVQKGISQKGRVASFPYVTSPLATAGDRLLCFTQQDNSYRLVVLTPFLNAFPLQLIWKLQVRSLDVNSWGNSERVCTHVSLADYVTSCPHRNTGLWPTVTALKSSPAAYHGCWSDTYKDLLELYSG